MNAIEAALAVHDTLTSMDVPHALGGALSLAYHGEPRGTLDVDINVFVPFADAQPVVDAMGELGFTPELPADRWAPVAGVRLREGGDGTPVDLFFSVDGRYSEIAQRCPQVPFGPDGIGVPILSAEDLVLFKLSFNRTKDWVDIDQVVRTNPSLDIDQIEELLVALRGPTMHPRVARLRRLARDATS